MRVCVLVVSLLVVTATVLLIAPACDAQFTCVSGATNQTVCDVSCSGLASNRCCPSDQECDCEGSTRTRFYLVCRDPPAERDDLLFAIGLSLIIPGAIAMLACMPCLLVWAVLLFVLAFSSAPCCGVLALIPIILCLPCELGLASFIAGIVLISLAVPTSE
jgi:hypothetical protein